MNPSIAITLGDPLGIGSEIVAKALHKKSIKNLAHWKIFGTSYDPSLSQKKAGFLSWDALNLAVTSIKKGECQALVTAPVSKTHLQLVGFPFPGQTEFLAHAFNTKQFAMMLAGPTLKVVLTTIHLPLAKVPKAITTALVLEKIKITHDSLKKWFGKSKPKIAVCGLNPHAGENGLFGNEEKLIILPAIRKAQKRGIKVTGPLPADTVFFEARCGKYDAVIAHYHDQGLGPLKTLHFDEGVNITLGLPILRTSPDHGCAFDIAGKNKANIQSMMEALRLAVQSA